MKLKDNAEGGHAGGHHERTTDKQGLAADMVDERPSSTVMMTESDCSPTAVRMACNG